jgi:hypothetical protein
MPVVNKCREYQAPSASIGSPEGYQFEPVTIPQYGAGDGGNSRGGGGWGRWGRGGNDGDGDPMKGFTYLFAALVFGMCNKESLAVVCSTASTCLRDGTIFKL